MEAAVESRTQIRWRGSDLEGGGGADVAGYDGEENIIDEEEIGAWTRELGCDGPVGDFPVVAFKRYHQNIDDVAVWADGLNVIHLFYRDRSRGHTRWSRYRR